MTMVDPKSRDKKFLLDLFTNLFSDLSVRYPYLTKSFRRDLETLVSRTNSEGLSFLTKTLPKLGKAFDRSLETGQFLIPKEFKPSHENRTIPAFLQGMFNCLFDQSGNLDGNDAEIVRDLRQFLFLAYKYSIPYSVVQEASVLESFRNTERELRDLADVSNNEVTSVARRIVTLVLTGFNPRLNTPRHGPGAVSTGEKLEEK